MWRESNIRCGAAATLGMLLAAVMTSVATARPAGSLPDPGDVVAAYATLRQWINAFDLPALDDPAAKVPLRNAGGACVVLRQSGRVVGVGVDASGGELMVRRAAGRALGEVLGDPAVAALPDSMVAGTGRALTVELEVAGGLVPLLGQTFRVIADQLAPGLDGVAMRRGASVVMVFPAQMRATNTAGRAERLLPPLAAELGLAPMTLPELTKRFELSIYRFETTHLAQARPDAAPFATYRGNTLVRDAQVTRDAVEALAAGIVDHLIESLSPLDDPLGVRGTYRAVVDHYDPLIAPPLEQALAAWALLRYAGAPGIRAEGALRARQTGMRILDELRRVAPGEDDPLADAVACAAIVQAVLAAGTSGTEPQQQEFFDGAVRRVLSAFRADAGFVQLDEAGGAPSPIPPHGQAMIAAALSRLLAAGAADAVLVRGALDAAWSSVPQHHRVSLLPWVGWAEADYAAATDGQNAQAEELRRLRAYLDASRLGRPRRPSPPDLAGGFALSTRGRILATSQTLRPAAYLVAMLRDPQLTPPEEAPAALGRMLETLRFVIQLSVRETSTWSFRHPTRALGGIRTATWDDDLPVAAQALGLVVAAETLTSLDALSRRPQGAP